jgi:hypothetical protein
MVYFFLLLVVKEQRNLYLDLLKGLRTLPESVES